MKTYGVQWHALKQEHSRELAGLEGRELAQPSQNLAFFKVVGCKQRLEASEMETSVYIRCCLTRKGLYWRAGGVEERVGNAGETREREREHARVIKVERPELHHGGETAVEAAKPNLDEQHHNDSVDFQPVHITLHFL